MRWKVIGATTASGTIAMEFTHRSYKILRMRPKEIGKKTAPPPDKVQYRVTHCNLFLVTPGESEGKHLATGVIRWPHNCSKDSARKYALALALKQLFPSRHKDLEERRKVWIGYLTRGTQKPPTPIVPPSAPAELSASIALLRIEIPAEQAVM